LVAFIRVQTPDLVNTPVENVFNDKNTNSNIQIHSPINYGNRFVYSNFSAVGQDFTAAGGHYAGVFGFNNDNSANININTTLNGFMFTNLSLTANLYFGAKAFFIYDPLNSAGDIDMDVLFSNGTTWLSGQSRSSNEIVGPALIPEDGQYILVFYPYIPSLNVTINYPNTITKLRLQLMDYPTLQDNDVDFNYFDSTAEIIPLVGAAGPPTASRTWNVRSRTMTTLTFGYSNIGFNVSFILRNSTNNILINTRENGTFTFIEKEPTTYTATFNTTLNTDIFFNKTELPYEDVFSRIPEVYSSKNTYFYELNTFNPDDWKNGYSSAENSFTGNASHLESYRIYLYKDTLFEMNISWQVGILSDSYNVGSDSLVRLINYNDTLDHSFTQINGTNFDINNYYSVSQIKTMVSETGWYIIQIGNRALNDLGISSPYVMEIIISDKFDIGGNNDAIGSSVLLSTPVSLIGLTNNQSSPDYFKVSSVDVYTNSRLIVDISYIYSHGQLNLFVLNATGNVVGTSNIANQNQQHIEVLVFTTGDYFILINTSYEYCNYYDLFVTVNPIDDKYEPNDQVSQPAQLPGAGIYHLFSAKGNPDYFVFTLFKEDRVIITINFNGSEANLNMFFYDSNLNLTSSSDSGSSDYEKIDTTATKTDTYFLRIIGISSSYLYPGIDYQLNLTIFENDDQFEPNDASGTARAIQDGSFPDLKIRAGDEDWYRIYLKAGEELGVSVDFNASNGDIDILLYNLGTTSILASSQTFSGHESFSYTPSTEGEVLLRVVLFDGVSLNYNMQITIPEIDDSHHFEDNDNFDQAVQIKPSVITGIEARGGDVDFFKISVPKDYAIIAEVTFTNINHDFDLSIYTQQQALIEYSDTNLNTERVGPIPVGESTDLFIEVHMKDYGLTTYTLNVTLGLKSVLIPAPVIPSGIFTVPSFGFPSTSINTGPTLDLIGGLTFTLIGTGIGAGAAVGGNFLYQKKKLKP
ncbi:MAG: hypothetical protein ACFFD1_06895, partial [Candidatus Thorarchaeota archaeon]